MVASADLFLPIYAAATIISAGLAVVVFRHRAKSGAVALLVCVLSVIVWTGSLFLASVFEDASLSMFFHRFLYVGVTGCVAATVLFALEYTGREHLVRRETVALLSIEPIVVVTLAFVNPGNVFFESLEPDPTTATGVTLEWGIAFDVHVVYSYALLAAATVLIAEFLYRSRSKSPYRGQAAALLGGTVIPWLANIVAVFGDVRGDSTAVGFVVAGGLYTIAIVWYGFVDVTPIARDRVFDTISEAVIVFDVDGRIVDANSVGRALAEDVLGDSSIVGRNVETLFADDPDLLDAYGTLTESADESRLGVSHCGRDYAIRATPIDDGRDRHVGWLVHVTDVTERNRRERELRRQNERLDRFASLVSHDLRNPLNVADGYLELAFEADDDERYLEEIDRSLERMVTIIDDVLALAREGAAVTDPRTVALESLAERAWSVVDTGEATLTIDADVRILADSERVRRLLENLFRNAIEHATDRDDAADLEVIVGTIGESDLESRDGPETDEIEGFYVEDDGDGIPPDERVRVLEDGYTTDPEGTGMGLSIVESIAAAHDWSVRVGEGDDGGARFEFTGVETRLTAPSSPSPDGDRDEGPWTSSRSRTR
ncbi:histidine kinase N-terminal 7TM domain-containing protein [Natrialbaceae archaeon GCM10025810]|uniref:sensor histidine kinase n=1 Tax=Halovalidus salilacus TaxID=3075124 RepID=UPI00361E5601